MTRIFGDHVSTEMLLLWLVEFLFCFLLFYILLSPTGEIGLGGFAVATNRLVHVNHAALLALTVGLISFCIGLYRPEICLQTRRLVLNTVVAGLLAFPSVLLVSIAANIDLGFILGRSTFWPMQILLSWILFLFATRIAFHMIVRHGLLERPVLILGTTPDAARIEEAIRAVRRGFFRVEATLPVAQAPAMTAAALNGRHIWGVVVASDAAHDLPRTAMDRLRDAGVRVFTDVEFREGQLRRLDLERLAPGWLSEATGLLCSPAAAALRRLGEILLSLAILVFILPVLLVAAVLIKLDSPGPVLYRQERVGLGGRRFVLLKLRSMRIDAEDQGPVWAARRDSRVTRVGSFLRQARIDELPQLINVLRGDMGFVGPRPERPHFVERLGEAIPFYHDRELVKPGVTGWAQVNYPYGASIEDARQKLAYDLYYVKHRSLFLDLLILFATVRVILFREGAR